MNNNQKELPIHFDYIEKAEKLTFEWAKKEHINLFKIEYIVPFVLTDISLEVWLFFDSKKKIWKLMKQMAQFN